MEADYRCARRDPGRARRHGHRTGKRPPQRSWLCVPRTVSTRRSTDPTIRRAPPPASTATHRGLPSLSRRIWGGRDPVRAEAARSSAPARPYPLTSRKYAADLNEVQRLGGDDVTTPSRRTAEQTEIALFWVESSPLHVEPDRADGRDYQGLDLWQSARLFGLLNLAMTDGYIGTFETKYHYRFWRPVTAIRLADIDGNPATTADPTWTPLVADPADPGLRLRARRRRRSRGAQVLKRFFDTDTMSFSVCSFTLPAGTEVRRRLTDAASLRQLLPGGRRERCVPHLRRLPLPRRGRDGDEARREDRQPGGQPFPANHARRRWPLIRIERESAAWHRAARHGRPDARPVPNPRAAGHAAQQNEMSGDAGTTSG